MLKYLIPTILFAFINLQIMAQKTVSKYSVSVKYEITIINYYFGRVDNRTVVTPDSLSYEKNIHRGNSKKSIRVLNDTEKKELEDLLKDFPLNSLKEKYVNNDVKDGTQMNFKITINEQTKEIFIANVYQEDLGKLVKLIVKMFPEDFIQYKKELIYPY
ncbi:MAG: hypothetical protein DRJ10_15130 [Bacteroidetes bacterium]|nr:MAG: hypothetical protein DRJ10_15130 [Bacteroidota bacterium]